ncbi:MAG: sigma-70 family RNA polymerase sigma factor [Tepidiformaceae bacterium]
MVATALATRTINTSTQRDAMIQQFAPLVKYVVGRMAIGLPAVLDHEDIISYGTIGLIEAVDRFDDSRGVKFETYAITRIRGAIIDALRGLDRLPRSLRQKARAIDAASQELSRDLDRMPTDFEVADALGVSLPEYQKTLVNVSWVTVSLDGMLDQHEDHDGAGMEVAIADPESDKFTGEIEHKELLADLAGAVSALPERELHIVSLYYQEALTMREIAQVLSISESRVCQLHARAVARLRSSLTAKVA